MLILLSWNIKSFCKKVHFKTKKDSKNSLPGIEPRTFRLWGKRINHSAKFTLMKFGEKSCHVIILLKNLENRIKFTEARYFKNQNLH